MSLFGGKNQSTSSETKSGGGASLIIGVILACVVFALVFIVQIGVQQKTAVEVAKNTVTPYSLITSSQFQAQSVPRDSVGPNDITPGQLQDLIDNNAVVTTTVLGGQRLDSRLVTRTNLGTLSVVKADERVVGVSTTFTGSVTGAVQPGMVVDVIGSNSGGGSGSAVLASNAKVMGVGQNAGANIAPAQSGSGSSGDKQAASSGSQGSIAVILAVASSDAPNVAGAQVSLDIVPTLCFTAAGDIRQLSSKGCLPTNAKNAQSLAPPAGATGATDTGTTTNTGKTGKTGKTTPAGTTGP